jgi:hypothetical protein
VVHEVRDVLWRAWFVTGVVLTAAALATGQFLDAAIMGAVAAVVGFERRDSRRRERKARRLPRSCAPGCHAWRFDAALPRGLQYECETCHSFLLVPEGRPSVIVTQRQIINALEMAATEEEIRALPEVDREG